MCFARGTLGLGGLFVRTEQAPAGGTSLQLLFNVPDGEVRVRAIVRNLEPGRGMGWQLSQWNQGIAHVWTNG